MLLIKWFSVCVDEKEFLFVKTKNRNCNHYILLLEREKPIDKQIVVNNRNSDFFFSLSIKCHV